MLHSCTKFCTRFSILIIYLLYLNYYWSTSFVFLFVSTLEIHYTEIYQKDIMLPTLKKKRSILVSACRRPFFGSFVRPFNKKFEIMLVSACTSACALIHNKVWEYFGFGL